MRLFITTLDGRVGLRLSGSFDSELSYMRKLNVLPDVSLILALPLSFAEAVPSFSSVQADTSSCSMLSVPPVGASTVHLPVTDLLGLSEHSSRERNCGKDSRRFSGGEHDLYRRADQGFRIYL